MQKLKEVKLSLYKSDPEQILDELDNGNNVRIILKKKAPQKETQSTLEKKINMVSDSTISPKK